MKPIIQMHFGSHVYGTNTPQSDMDFKGIFMPSVRDIVLGQVHETITHNTKKGDGKNSPEDIDSEFHSLKKYMALLLQGQTVALDMFFTPKEFHLIKSGLWDELQRLKEHWLHKNILPFIGYCRQQANKYGIKGSRVAATRDAMHFFKMYYELHGSSLKLHDFWNEIEKHFVGKDHVLFMDAPMKGQEKVVRMLDICDRKVQEHVSVKEAYAIYKRVFDEYGQRALQAESNENIDWKAMGHAVRICGQAHELLLEHSITFPRPDKDFLRQIREGKLPYKEVAEHIEIGMERLTDIQKNSSLPDKPNYQLAEDIVYQEYRHVISLEDR
jgi:predicted nucleotidyltransferase